MRSVDTGHEPPVPVSWMMRPVESTFIIRLVRAASGATKASASTVLSATSRVQTPGHLAPADSAASGRTSSRSSSRDIRYNASSSGCGDASDGYAPMSSRRAHCARPSAASWRR